MSRLHGHTTNVMNSLSLQTEEDKKNLAKLASGSGGQTADEGEGLQEAG